MERPTTQKTVEGLLKTTHEIREKEIADVLLSTRKPEDFLRRMDREDKRYYDVTEAVRKYFETIDEAGLVGK